MSKQNVLSALAQCQSIFLVQLRKFLLPKEQREGWEGFGIIKIKITLDQCR